MINLRKKSRWGPSFEQDWIFFTHECFVPSWVEIFTMGLEKKIDTNRQYILILKCVKKIKFTLPKDALYQVAVKLVLWFLEKKFCMLLGRLELKILMSNKLGYMKFWRFFNKWKWRLHRQWTLVHQKAFSVQRFLQPPVTVGVAYFKRTLTAQWP